MPRQHRRYTTRNPASLSPRHHPPHPHRRRPLRHHPRPLQTPPVRKARCYEWDSKHSPPNTAEPLRSYFVVVLKGDGLRPNAPDGTLKLIQKGCKMNELRYRRLNVALSLSLFVGYSTARHSGTLVTGLAAFVGFLVFSSLVLFIVSSSSTLHEAIARCWCNYIRRLQGEMRGNRRLLRA